MVSKNWFDIELATLPVIKLWDDWEHKVLRPLSYLKEYESKWVLEFDLPLVEKKDINVYLEKDFINVEAKLKERYVDSKGSQNFEFEYFKSSVRMPGNVDAKKISARFKDGLLKITLPKSHQGAKIKIQ